MAALPMLREARSLSRKRELPATLSARAPSRARERPRSAPARSASRRRRRRRQPPSARRSRRKARPARDSARIWAPSPPRMRRGRFCATSNLSLPTSEIDTSRPISAKSGTVIAFGAAPQFGNVRNVDRCRWRGEAQGEARELALPAGDPFRRLPAHRAQSESLVQRGPFRIGEGRPFHAGSSRPGSARVASGLRLDGGC